MEEVIEEDEEDLSEEEEMVEYKDILEEKQREDENMFSKEIEEIIKTNVTDIINLQQEEPEAAQN